MEKLYIISKDIHKILNSDIDKKTIIEKVEKRINKKVEILNGLSNPSSKIELLSNNLFLIEKADIIYVDKFYETDKICRIEEKIAIELKNDIIYYEIKTKEDILNEIPDCIDVSTIEEWILDEGYSHNRYDGFYHDGIKLTDKLTWSDNPNKYYYICWFEAD